MTEEEVREIYKLLEEQGWEPRLCDTPVPCYDNAVMCGIPADWGDVVQGDNIVLPKELLGDEPTFLVPVRGDSMKDAGLSPGDMIHVQIGTSINDGDIVLAMIDGEMTVKCYCEDDRGNRWLVPRNEDYDAILLTDEMNVKIIGKVTNIMKPAPRGNYSDCMRQIRKTRNKLGNRRRLTQRQVDSAIVEIASSVEHGRQWYAVYRALVDRNAIGEGDYGGLVETVERLCPDHGHKPVAVEMQRMCVQSFARPVSQWENYSAPVSGKRFSDYLSIARKMLSLLR